MTTAAQLANIGSASSAPFSFRNKIINGKFDIWQRSTSDTYSGVAWRYGSADRWRYYSLVTTGSVTVSQQAFTIGQTDVPGEPTYFLRWNQTVAAGGGVYLTQPVEDVRTLAGKTCTLSFYAKASSASTLATQFVQDFGSGGSAAVLATGQNNNLTTSWQKFTYTAMIPSISGKTLGTGHFFDVRFINNSAATFLIDIANVQLEEGVSATSFEQRPYGLELSLCQRYYEVFVVSAAVPSGAVVASVVASATYAAIKRASPTISRIADNALYGASGSTGTTSYITATDGMVAYRSSSGTAAQQQFSERLSASAEL